MELLNNPIFLLLTVTLIGMGVGKITIKDFSLDSSAIIFVALLFGHLGYTLPKTFQTFGLVLFIYSIGLQAGPGFLYSLRNRGIKLTLGTIVIISAGFLTTLAVSWFYDFDSSTAAGIFAGALTSTPGLAVAVELTGNGHAPAAYGVTYFFGIIGVIVFVQIIPKILKINVKEEEENLARERDANNKPLDFLHLELTNQNLFNKKVKDLNLKNISSAVITRLLRKGASEPIVVQGDTLLQQGDHLRITGTSEDLNMMCLYLGKVIDHEIEFERVLTKEYIVVSNKKICGMTLKELNCREVFNVQISRVTRNGIELAATPQLQLHMGDKLHAVGNSHPLDNMKKLYGNSVKDSYSISLLPIFMGLFFGFLLGKVPLYLPFVGVFYLGTTGGVLMSGLILSNLYKTGPLIWEIPSHANSFIRELGLVLFMATIGTNTGSTIVATIHAQGISLCIAGVFVTIVPLICSVLFCRYVLKLPFLTMLGVITGSMTSTPGLATTTKISNTHYASSAYATVYPMALIAMILLTKALLFLL